MNNQLTKLGPKGKQGFGTVMTLVGGVIGLIFLTVFAFVFIDKLTTTNLLTANGIGANATDRMEGNFAAGVDEVSNNIVTVFSIGVFILIVTVLLLAYVLARSNGLIGGTANIG